MRVVNEDVDFKGLATVSRIVSSALFVYTKYIFYNTLSCVYKTNFTLHPVCKDSW